MNANPKTETPPMKGAKPAEIIAARMIDAINKGVSPWARPWRTNSIPAPCNGVSKRRYSGINFFVLAMSGFNSPYWFTFNKMKELGGRKKEGERGTPVALWLFPDKAEIAKRKAAEKYAGPTLRYYTVFNGEQIDGMPSKYVWTPAPVDSAKIEGKLIDEASACIDAWGQKVPISYGGAQAYYAPFEDKIRMPQVEAFKSFDHYFQTMFHEMGHSTGHDSRLARDLSGAFGTKKYAQEELVAELTASLCGAHFGFDVAGNDASYLKSWIGSLENDPQEIMRAASKAQKAFDLLVGAPPTAAEDEPEILEG